MEVHGVFIHPFLCCMLSFILSTNVHGMPIMFEAGYLVSNTSRVVKTMLDMWVLCCWPWETTKIVALLGQRYDIVPSVF